MGARPDLAQRNRERARHGMSRTRVHQIWSCMRQRCESPTCKDYPRYGGRGIKVCQRWSVFENFLEDMGQPPAGASIDRIDNNGDYTPENCRWATNKQQSNNRRSNVMITYNALTLTAAQWSERTGIERKTIEYRIRAGWHPSQAVTEPSRTNRKKTNGN